MVDSIDSVNDIVVLLEDGKRSHEERGNRERAIEFAKHIQNLKSFIRDYQDMEKKTRPIPVMNGDDLSDLPPELLKELSSSKTDDLEQQIITVVNAASGAADIDTILIHLFRRFKIVQTRRFLQNKLWRMTQKEILWSVEGKKGLYSTIPPLHDDEDESTHETGSVTINLEDSTPF